MRLGNSHILAFFVCGLFGDPAAASQEATDMKLENAGFVMRPANTAHKLKRVKLLPPRKFVRRSKAGRHYYLYADPDDCKCVFVGDQRAMVAYRNLVSPPPSNLPTVLGSSGPTQEGAVIEAMNSDVGDAIPAGDILDFTFR